MTSDDLAAPHRIWANPKAIDRFYDGASLYSTPSGFAGEPDLWPSYILATPAALAASPEVQAMIREAYALGFEASGEGWNGEYPTADFRDDPVWQSYRDKNLAAALKGETT